MNWTRLMSACGRAFIVSLVLTPIVRDVFRSYNVVDRPGIRKVHNYPIPRVGGVPIALAYLLALMMLRGEGSPFPAHWIQTLLSGALIIFLTGLIDDFFNLKPRVKLMGQVAAGVVAFAGGLRIDNVAGTDLPVWISLPCTVLWLLLATNALNLIDGLDGLCAGVGFWGTLAFLAAATMAGDALLAYTVLPLAGALLGFLFFNFNPATVFLGDSGALLIGFLLGCFGIVWANHQPSAAAAAFPLFALCVPLLDLGSSIVRRSLKRHPIFSADRGHMHHKLIDRGLTVRQCALRLYGAAIAGAAFGLMLALPRFRQDGNAYVVLRGIAVAGALATTVAGFRYLRYPEFEVAGRLLFGGQFQRVFAQQLRMRKLAASLEQARSGEEWWQRLAAAARDEDWIRVQWLAGSGEIRTERLSDRTPLWVFRVALTADEWIHVEGDAQTAKGSSDLISLSDLLSRSMQGHRRSWEQAALS